MPEDVYYVRIKKSYAADVIEDLQKMDAVERPEEPAHTGLAESGSAQPAGRIEEWCS